MAQSMVSLEGWLKSRYLVPPLIPLPDLRVEWAGRGLSKNGWSDR
jgi:hypothetical protein